MKGKRKIVAGFFLAAPLVFLFYGRACSGITLVRVVSPDGHYIAEITRLVVGDSLAVFLRTSHNPIRTFVFGGYDTGGTQIQIAWQDISTLHVTCRDCRYLRPRAEKQHWKDVTITYDIEE